MGTNIRLLDYFSGYQRCLVPILVPTYLGLNEEFVVLVERLKINKALMYRALWYGLVMVKSLFYILDLLAHLLDKHFKFYA